jgi:hypothetical protein
MGFKVKNKHRGEQLIINYITKAAYRIGAIIFAIAVTACFVAPPVHAVQTVPYKMNFQGRLTDSTGTPMANGLYNMTFRIFDASTAGTLQWSELREVGNRVQVTNGLFSVQLGDVTSLPPGIFTNQNLYFEIELPTPATATCSTSACASYTEGPMTPRNKLATSAYAFNADQIDGIDGSSLARNDTTNTFTSSQTFKNTADSTNAFSIQKSAGDVLLQADTTNNHIIIGNATGTDTATTLLVLDSAASDPTTGVVNGAMYYNTATNKFRCRQGGAFVDCIGAGGASTHQITLAPEYTGAVLYADGINNSVNFTSSAVSGLAAGQGYKHNFYAMTSGSATAQHYDIIVNYQLPSDFTSFSANSFKLWTYADSLASTGATFMIKSSTGALCYASPVSVLPSIATTWQQLIPGNPGNGCTFAANDIITIDIQPTAIQPSTNKVEIGEIQFAYQ